MRQAKSNAFSRIPEHSKAPPAAHQHNCVITAYVATIHITALCTYAPHYSLSLAPSKNHLISSTKNSPYGRAYVSLDTARLLGFAVEGGVPIRRHLEKHTHAARA